jgi:hypothetical protein
VSKVDRYRSVGLEVVAPLSESKGKSALTPCERIIEHVKIRWSVSEFKPLMLRNLSDQIEVALETAAPGLWCPRESSFLA